MSGNHHASSLASRTAGSLFDGHAGSAYTHDNETQSTCSVSPTLPLANMDEPYDSADLAFLEDLLLATPPNAWEEMAFHVETCSDESGDSEHGEAPTAPYAPAYSFDPYTVYPRLDRYETSSDSGSTTYDYNSSCPSSEEDVTVHKTLLAESGTVLLSTDDAVLVSAPQIILTKYITFLSSLPPTPSSLPPPEEGFPHPSSGTLSFAASALELPSATSGGLLLVIGLLRSKYLGEDTQLDPVDPERELDFTNLQSIVDALIIADIYDISAILEVFAQIAYDTVYDRPLFAWVIGTLAGGHPGIDFPSLIAETLQYEPILLPSEARAILCKYIPDALAILEADQLRWIQMLDRLRSEMISLAPMSVGINRYTLRCLGRTKRYIKDGPGCLEMANCAAECGGRSHERRNPARDHLLGGLSPID